MRKPLLALAACVSLSWPGRAPAEGLPAGRLAEALDVIRTRFLEEMTREELEERALLALLKDLDPYSRYLDAGEWAEFDDRLSAELCGVGITFGFDGEESLPVVERLLVGSGGAEAGVREGDRIAAADGRSLAGATFDEVRSQLVGPAGSFVELVVCSRGSSTASAIRIRRRPVALPSVRGVRRDGKGRSEYFLDATLGIGYVRISRLAEDTVRDVELALSDLERRGLRGLVLDLRESEGGLMEAAVGVADLFLHGGRILSTVTRAGTTHRDATPGACTDVPVVVLIDSGTASSSEFLAAALKDNGRAVFVGQRTFGKGRIQERLALGEGGLVLTTGRHGRPDGTSFDRYADGPDVAGVDPDPGMEIVVEGAEREDWSSRALLRDAPIAFDEETGGKGPDRVLEMGVKALAELTRRTPSRKP
ncbi:MAG: S41 family peptidase [Thermoanaerobaculia bacterium]